MLLRRLGRVPARDPLGGTARASRAPSSSPARALRAAGLVAGQPGRSPTPTTRALSTGSTSRRGVSKKVGADHFHRPVKTLAPRGRRISKWIAYSVNNQAYIQRVWVYSLEKDKAFPDLPTGSPTRAEPVFDKSGKYLFFFASTDAGPVSNWFSLENQDLRVTRSIYLAVLRKRRSRRRS